MHQRYQQVLDKIGLGVSITNTEIVAGGCINKTTCLQTNNGHFFLKENTIENQDLFEKETLGLSLLAEKSQIKTPMVFGQITDENYTYLVLEWIEKGAPSHIFWENFGNNLAHQHKQVQNHYGLDHHNHIGRLDQHNNFRIDWIDFFINERLLPQIKLGETRNLIDPSLRNQFDSLFTRLDQLIPTENPSLLHGDLWSGNFLCSSAGQPYVFDPAVYYGNREVELAFTQLFGGFDPFFYGAYEEAFPLTPGYQERVEIHNLYPLLVHVNLFGASYLTGIKQTLNKFT